MFTPRWRHLGEKLSAALRIGGAILVAAGLLHLYADRVVFDARTFAARAAASLGDPGVAQYAAERIADEVIARKRDVISFRPLLIATARSVVSSEAFRAGLRRALQGAHATFFSTGAKQVALSIPDVGVLVRSALANDPNLAARVPADLSGRISADTTGQVARTLVELLQLGHRFRRNAFVAIGLGASVFLVGILLPQDRRRALLQGGAVLATVALLLFALPGLGRAVITAAASNAALAAGLWEAFAGGLRHWALALAAVGIVMASAASSFASHVEIERVGRRVWDALRAPAGTWLGEILRAAMLTSVGVYAAMRPMAVLQGATVIAGALLAFEGLRELFRLVPPRLQEAARLAAEGRADADDVRGHSGAHVWIRAGLVGLTALALVVAAILFMRSPGAVPGAPALTDACNGDRRLCERRLDEVVFPGAHNSMSAAEYPGWMFPNQERGTVSLLGHGIRAMLFDVHYGTPVGDRVKTDIQDERASRAKFEEVLGVEGVDAAMRIRDRLTGAPTGPRAAYLCHGFCEIGAVPLVPTLAGVREFLVQNPGEVLIFVIEDYVTPSDIEAAFKESGLDRFVYRGAVTPPFPTLREMIDADQRLVVFGEHDTGGVAWFHQAFDTIQETPYTFRAPGEFSCRPNRGGTSGPLFQINHWIETTPTPRPSNAAIVNARDVLLARALQCERERVRRPNILAVDFALTGDVVGVAAELNGLAGTARQAPR